MDKAHPDKATAQATDSPDEQIKSRADMKVYFARNPIMVCPTHLLMYFSKYSQLVPIPAGHPGMHVFPPPPQQLGKKLSAPEEEKTCSCELWRESAKAAALAQSEPMDSVGKFISAVALRPEAPTESPFLVQQSNYPGALLQAGAQQGLPTDAGGSIRPRQGAEAAAEKQELRLPEGEDPRGRLRYK